MDRLIELNLFFSNIEDIVLLEEFQFVPGSSTDLDGGTYQGLIDLNAAPKDSIQIVVRIPETYPLSNDLMSIRFICVNKSGIRHLNADNSICIHTEKHHDFLYRLKKEVEMVFQWRDKYYINEHVDEKYEYLITEFTQPSCYLFTDVTGHFQKEQFGEYKYVVFNNHNVVDTKLDGEQAIIISIGDNKCEWSDNITLPQKKGLFYFIGDEPIVNNRTIVSDWMDMEPFLSDSFIKKLCDLKNSCKRKDESTVILFGYNIPASNEIHWQAIKVKLNELPVKGIKNADGSWDAEIRQQTLKWIKTQNASYRRFFGRGGVCPGLQKGKILILGLGAIGASLGKILVRGGAREIDFSDRELVEPGNLCRSEYLLLDNNFPKAIAFQRQLLAISPFYKGKYIGVIPKLTDKSSLFNLQQFLNQYDFIFDCTSDAELSFVIDKITIKAHIINISVTNKAKQLICVSGENITEVKSQLFSKYQKEEGVLFYEGTGCWSPTFEASYFDINSLLNLAAKNINLHLKSNNNVRTFIIDQEITDNSVNLKTIVY